MQEKIKIHFTDQNVSSYNINLTMAFFNWPIKTYILKIWWRVYNLRHTTMFTYSHANTPLGQSEHAYYLSYFIKNNTNHKQTNNILQYQKTLPISLMTKLNAVYMILWRKKDVLLVAKLDSARLMLAVNRAVQTNYY